MKKYSKIKRIFAMIGVIVLVGLYLSTLCCALFAKDNVMDFMMASIYATVIIPVILWAYAMICRLAGKDDDETQTFQN